MPQRQAFSVLLPDSFGLTAWQVDRHEVLTTSVRPTSDVPSSAGFLERASQLSSLVSDSSQRSARAAHVAEIGVDVYQDVRGFAAIDLWWAIEVEGQARIDRHTVGRSGLPSNDLREAALRILLEAVEELSSGVAALVAGWPDGLWVNRQSALAGLQAREWQETSMNEIRPEDVTSDLDLPYSRFTASFGAPKERITVFVDSGAFFPSGGPALVRVESGASSTEPLGVRLSTREWARVGLFAENEAGDRVALLDLPARPLPSSTRASLLLAT